MNNLILKFIFLFNPFWRKLGINTVQLKAILSAKLMMDDRRPSAFRQGRRRQEKQISNATWLTMLFSLLMGVAYLFVFAIPADALFHLTVYFSMYMVLLAITLISDFTYVLIDVKDNYIILPKPVNDRTVVISRLLHILVHACKIILPMTLPALILLLIRHGLAGGLVFAELVVPATLLTIFFINALYLVILRVTTVSRFKEIINYVQIGFSIIIFALYYFVPHLADKAVFTHVDILTYKGFYAAPPLWFASAWVVAVNKTVSPLLLVFSALAVILPLLCIIVVIRYFAPSFNKKLSMMMGGGGSPGTVRKETGRKWYKKFSTLFARGAYEQAGFEHVWLLTGRNRDFKLKVYPSFAYVIIYFFYFGLARNGGYAYNWSHLPQTRTYVLLIYFSSFAMLAAISQLIYSDKYKAAWIYHAAPVGRPGELLTGALKAALVKYFLPFYLIIAVFTLCIWKIKVLPDLFLGFVNVALISVLMGFIYLKKMPFSDEQNIQRGSGKFIRSLFLLIVPGFLGVLHYFVSGMIAVIIILTILAAVLLWVVLSKYRELSWKEIKE